MLNGYSVLSGDASTLAAERRRQVLLLGATSLIGRFLTPRLEKAGFDIMAVSRAPPSGQPSQVQKEGAGRLQWRKGDLTAIDLWPSAPAAEAVISLSPIWLLPAALPHLLKTGAKRLVAFSSTSLLTKMQSPVAAERAVAQRLAEGESKTLSLCSEAGVDCTLLRPTLIYAEGQDRNISRLAGLIQRLGVLPLSGGGEGLRQPVHADDLAWAALALLDAPSTYGKIYNLPGGESLSYRSMVERVFKALGRKPRIVIVPPLIWRLGLTLASPVLTGATFAMGQRMAHDLTFDAGPAAADFNWSPRPFQPRFGP